MKQKLETIEILKDLRTKSFWKNFTGKESNIFSLRKEFKAILIYLTIISENVEDYSEKVKIRGNLEHGLRLFDGLINEPDLTNIQSFIDFIICEYEYLKYFPITYDFIVNIYLIVYEFDNQLN